MKADSSRRVIEALIQSLETAAKYHSDDVVRTTRPFMTRDIPGGKGCADILRAKPNIKWSKDRGKEPMRVQAQFPWFWNNGKFTGERVNDVHLTNAAKRAAREVAATAPIPDRRNRRTGK